jgi:tripartite-type tricarboxylate transporter receptor subunit TctC
MDQTNGMEAPELTMEFTMAIASGGPVDLRKRSIATAMLEIGS